MVEIFVQKLFYICLHVLHVNVRVDNLKDDSVISL